MMSVVESHGVIRDTQKHHYSNTISSLILVILNVYAKTLNYFHVHQHVITSVT